MQVYTIYYTIYFILSSFNLCQIQLLRHTYGLLDGIKFASFVSLEVPHVS